MAWEDSRDQIGCSISALMLLSAAFSLRAAFRGVILAPAPDVAMTSLHATPVMIALATALIVFAFFALKLKLWAIGGYGLAALLGIAFAAMLHLGFGVIGPLLIGPCAVAAIVMARRDLFF